MAVTTDIKRTWRQPRAVMADLLAMGQREDRVIAYGMAACFLIFIAQWPRLQRAEQFELYGSDGASDFAMNAGIAFLSMMVVWPLALYLLSAIVQVVLRLVGFHISPYASRLALFWTLLATTPVLLLHGLTMGLIGAGPAASLVGAVWAVAFGIIWAQCLRAARQAFVA